MKPSAVVAVPSWNAIRRRARECFGVERFRPGQRPLIRAAFEGRDVLGVLPTGAGKSLCFQLPAQMLPGRTVVVSPLLALIEDQTRKLDDIGLEADRLDSTLTAREGRAVARKIRHSESILYVTPEQLEKPELTDELREAGVALFVVDEAHCVARWGHDFRPAYLALRDAVRRLGRPPIMALTATATPAIEEEIAAQLGMRHHEVVREDMERPNIFFRVTRTPSDDAKEAALLSALRAEEGPAIVYTSTVAAADALAKRLEEAMIEVTRYHGKLKMSERRANQEAFMHGEKRVIVATNAFGLGVDKPDVRLVVHYNFPDSLESYYQEAGRAGRDGRPARALLLYRLEDKRVQSYFLGGKYPKRDQLLAAYDALSVDERPCTLADVMQRTSLSERRVKVIVAMLESMGIVRRARRQVRLVRHFADAAELVAYADSYEERFDTDRDKLDTMMRYAQSTTCRTKLLADYFGETHDDDCAHCDNCEEHPAEALAEASAERATPVPPPATVLRAGVPHSCVESFGAQGT